MLNFHFPPGSDKDFTKATEPSTSPTPIRTEGQSEGEKMTGELMAIISQFGDKVNNRLKALS